MIELTVKTLDSVNHSFSVEDETTVAQLKEKIREALGFELDNQRLIFCGRVLLDDQTLQESGVDNGKCLHLVERPPPSPPSRRRDRDRMEGGHAGDHRGRDPNQLYTIRMSPRHELLMQQQMAFISPTAGRLNSIRGMITEIRATLTALRIRAGDLVAGGGPEASRGGPEASGGGPEASGGGPEGSGGGPEASGASRNDESTNMETDSSGEAQAQPENADERDDDDEESSTHAQRHRRQRAARSMGPRFPANPRDLGRMLEELDRLHDEFAPFRAEYVAMLRTLTLHNYPEAERQQRQDVVRLICDIMHSFAHSYHTISDITFNVGQRPPRLSSESPASARSLPVQAHINVVSGPHSMSGDRRGAGAGSAVRRAATTATATTSATATATTATGGTATIVTGANASAPLASQASTPRPATLPPATPTDLETISDTFDVRGTTSTDCLPVETITSTYRRPLADRSSSPAVDVATRGEVGLPSDTSSLSGLAAVASDMLDARGQHARALADAHAAQEAAAVHRARTNPIQVPPSNRRRRNLPPALIALENLDSWGPVGRAALTAADARSAPTAPSEPTAPSAPIVLPAPTAPSALSASGSTFLGSIPINIGPRSAPAAANASQRPSEGTGGASSGATGSARPRTGAVPLSPQSPGHAHVHVTTRLLDPTRDGSRPNIHLDVEDFMRNLAGGVGMEVVMSMEEIPNFLAGLDADVNDQAGVYVTPLYAAHNVGGTPTADLLQSIVAIVRNRLVPQDPTQSQGQSQTRGQGQAQNQGQSQNQGSDQNNAERRNQWQAPWGGPLRRAADTQYPFAISCFEYDRYLACESVHAREHLQVRREIYQRQAEAERDIPPRPAPPDIADIRVGNRRFTAVHMLTMMRLLNDPLSEQGQLNAFMLTVARQVFLHPGTSALTHTTGPIPSEFAAIRIQLRNFIHRMMQRSTDMGRHLDRFEAFSERLFMRAESFLRDIPRLEFRGTTSTAVIDPTESLRAFIIARMPTVIAWIMSEAPNEIIATRFYNVIYSFFADLCTLFMRFLKNDFDGLVRRYDAFMAGITENYGSSTRNWLRLVSHENIVASRSYIESNTNIRNVRQYLRRADGSVLPPPCCLYQAMREGENIMRNQTVLAEYCEWHLQQLMPLQAPPLLPPPSSDDDSTKGSTPTTTKSRNGQREHADQKDETGSDSQASGPDAGPQQRSEGSSVAGSPSHSRSEPQAEAEPEEGSASETSATETGPSEDSPRRVRRWGLQSPTDSQSFASDLTSESHPPGIMAITITDVDSLCDVEELDVEALVDDVDPYICDYTTQRKTVVYSPLNIIEDEADDDVNEDEEVDIENIEDESCLVAEELEIRIRREKRERSIRRDVARRRIEGNVRQRRLISLQETSDRLDLRAAHLSDWKMDYDEHLRKALDRVVEERKRFEERGEQAHGTDEEYDEISEGSEPTKKAKTSKKSKSRISDEDRVESELADMREELERLHAEMDILSEHTSLYYPPAEQLEQIMYPAVENEPADDYLDPQPGSSGISTHVRVDEFELLHLNHVTMMPLQMSQLNINDSEFLTPILFPQSNDAVRDGNDLESEDASSRAGLSPIHRPAQGADDDWYSHPPYRYPYPELDFDGYYSPQLSTYHERPRFLTPQPVKANAAAARPSAATTKSVSDQSEEYNDEEYNDEEYNDEEYNDEEYNDEEYNDEEYNDEEYDDKENDDEDYDDFNSMVSHLRIESNEPEQNAPQTLKPTTEEEPTVEEQPTKEKNTQQATEIAENVAQTNNAETERKDIPHTSDELDLATQAPMEGIVEDEDLRSIMGSNWEPVLREDGAAQARGVCPQPPFSDAYLSGMPARKRRCLRDSRPDATLDGLMNDGLRGVSEGIPGGLRGGEAELTQLLRDSVRGLVAARARDQPEDYEPTRFPNTAAFLANADRTKTKEPEEKTPTPPKRDVPDSVE